MAVGEAARTSMRHLLIGSPNAGDHARARIPEINAALASAPAGFILTAGDSHAHAIGQSSLCGRTTVSGGSDGAGGRVYATAVRGLVFRERPAAIVLTIGANDLLLKNKPSRPDNLARLASYDREIIRALAETTDRLVVTAIPPVAAQVAAKFDLKGLADLSGELERICRETPSCVFADPFAPLRAEDFGIARPGALIDDLHLGDYPEAYRRLEPQLCPQLQSSISGRPE
jgi:hypothetical protein